MATRESATSKKLRQLARACDREADLCQDAANLCITEGGVAMHTKNAKVWRSRSRTCWKAVELLAEAK
jgi:hypothetical protein